MDHSFRCEQYMISRHGTELAHAANFNMLLALEQLAGQCLHLLEIYFPLQKQQLMRNMKI